MEKMNDFKQPTLFIAYAHEYERELEQQKYLLSLINHLRINGIDATCDFIELSNQSSSSHIPSMEIEGLNRDKVLIILSKLYKKKAEAWKGGVGEEFSQISAEINNDEYKNKYILGYIRKEGDNFNPSLICPSWMRGKEIIDLSDVDGLVRKIHGIEKYKIAPLSPYKPSLPLIEADDFKLMVEKMKVKNQNNYGFENISIITKTTFYSQFKMKYEVKRVIKVIDNTLPRVTIKPTGCIKRNVGECSLMEGDTIVIKSLDFGTIKIVIEKEGYIVQSNNNVQLNNLKVDVLNCSILFDYPIPNNKFGDRLFIDYCIEINSQKGFESQEQFKSVNNSKFELHEIVLPKKKYGNPANLSVLDLSPRSAQYSPCPLDAIPFNNKRKSYTVYFECPPINVLYFLSWDW